MKLLIKLAGTVGIYYASWRIGSHVGNTFAVGFDAALIGSIVSGFFCSSLGKDE